MNELLALLGLAWPRLLLYPGGLFALVLVWLWGRAIQDTRHETRDTRQLWSFSALAAGFRSGWGGGSRVSVLHTVPPLLAMSLLPLPFAAQFSRSLDLLAVVILLEWPELVRLAASEPEAFNRRLRQLGLGYGLLLPAILALAEATHSFAVDSIVARPGEIELLALLLRLGAVGGWALALLPLLRLGPFRSEGAPLLGEAVRAVAHIVVVTLPVLALLGERVWLAPLAPLALTVLLCVVHRRSGTNSRGWEIAAQGGAVLLWVVLAWSAVVTLLARAT